MEKIFRQIKLYRCNPREHLQLLYVEEGIPAGFPSPAMDYISPAIDLNEELIAHQAATFVGRVSGELCFDGLQENDVIIVDTSLKAKDKDLVLCVIDGELTIRMIRKERNNVYFEEGVYGGEVVMLGVVTYTIHACRRFVLNEEYQILDEVSASNLLQVDYPSTDLNKLFIQNPASTFFSQVAGDSLKDAGLNKGDVVIVDKSLSLRHNDIAVCFLDNSFTLKFVRRDNNVIWLMPANPDFKPIKVVDEDDFRVWGVVTFIIKTRRKKR
ncbi:translesion error-prone DNA polymerase V autoproteolytic subunit [Butyricimonas paravirosa]|uniref:translesion error-prone DNA polymerase V autoproteolytic subunit n=1 Tax=Butyricimonas paravirosa TaxID=1472417 RepID=UPI00210942C6|nr:translesion error-prone DNA polymerase V autoproteolytic subunit [Butyricimonas paravirosa]MCQ4875685.1 translesion error-prone DNA polymerase V autoproteolytic subunit [Butyricimonas paravirosa]